MAELTQRLRNILPSVPRSRYSIFAGTNTAAEWHDIFEAWLKDERPNNESEIATYETEFAHMAGVTHAISFGAGRMALYAILQALDIRAGDEIIIPAYTCVVVPNAILYHGARPVYVDIEPNTFNIDVNRIESAITARTRALYAQHTFGVPCDLYAIQDIGRRHGLPVIEDCGHAQGATLNGRPVGSLTEVAFFTTDHSKMIGTYLGGMATTGDSGLGRKIRDIQQRTPFLPKHLHRRLLKSFLTEYVLLAPSAYWLGKPLKIALSHLGCFFSFQDELLTSRPQAYPYPCRLSAQQARLGRSQLRLLASNLKHRRRLAGWLESHIGWYRMDQARLAEGSWLRYSFLVRDRHAFEQRFRKRFDLGIWFTSIAHGRQENFEAIGYREKSCPVAQKVSRHIANFPTHQRLPLEVLRREYERNDDWLKSQIVPPEELK